MVLQITENHLVSNLPRRGTEVPSCPKVTSPITLLKHRKFFKQLLGCPALDSPHDFTRRHCRWCRQKNMHMVLAYYSTEYADLKGFACLTNQFSHAQGHITCKNFLSVFRNPNKMVLNVENRVTPIPIIHSAHPLNHATLSQKGVINPPAWKAGVSTL